MSITEDDDGIGWGVRGNSKAGFGLLGLSDDGPGVAAGSLNGSSLVAASIHGQAIRAIAGDDAITATSRKKRGVVGASVDSNGVSGESEHDNGVIGSTKGGASAGVFGRNQAHDGGNGVTGLAEGAGGVGVFGGSRLRGVGVSGQGATGVVGVGDAGPGLLATSEQDHGVIGKALRGRFAGVFGMHAGGALDDLGSSTGVHGRADADTGVFGEGRVGVSGRSTSRTRGWGVVGAIELSAAPSSSWGLPAGVLGLADGVFENGVRGLASGAMAAGVYGENTNQDSISIGVLGKGAFAGVQGEIAAGPNNDLGSAVLGSASKPFQCAIRGVASQSATGVHGQSESGAAVVGWCLGSGAGVYGRSPNPKNVGGYAFAGMFHGAVNVTGPVHKSGGGFLIDHPDAPGERYLSHSFVESDERMNLYRGTAELDERGAAVVTLPTWFNSLNTDICYQLTPLGAPAPELHIAEEVADGRFRIAGGRSRQRISWQITARRCDAWALANPQEVEIEKGGTDRGRYRHPELFGADRAADIDPVYRRLSEMEPRSRYEGELVEVLRRGQFPRGETSA